MRIGAAAACPDPGARDAVARPVHTDPAVTALSHVAPPAVPGRRRESSRHRTSGWYGLPGWFAWLLRSGTPLVSLLPAALAVVLVQSLSPAAQGLPTGSARFALAGAWATTDGPAVVGYDHWFTTPVFGWLQLGALDRALLGGTAQSVLAAAHGAMLLLTLAGVVLLWFVLRRAGASGLAAGAASAAFGITPISVVVHTVLTPTAVALVWLLISALLVLGSRRPVAAFGIGAAAGAAVLSDPMALAALPVLVWLLVTPPSPLRRGSRPTIVAAAGLAVVVGGGVVVALILSAQHPAGAAASTANAIGAAAAAQTPMAAGAAAALAWLRTDPLSLLIGTVAVLLIAARPAPALAAVLALVAVPVLAAVWPDRRDATGPVLLLLPLLTFATAVVIDRAVVALGRPRFLASLIGSGWLMAVLALILVAGVTWAGSLASLRPGGQLPLSRAERWVAATVPPDRLVLVDLGMWPDFALAVHGAVGWYAPLPGAAAPSSAPWPRVEYLVTAGSALNDSAGAARQALRRSFLVVRFGSGAAPVEVRAVRPAG